MNIAKATDNRETVTQSLNTEWEQRI